MTLRSTISVRYANLRQRQAITNVTIQRRKVWSLADARLMLARIVGALDDGTALDTFLIRYAMIRRKSHRHSPVRSQPRWS